MEFCGISKSFVNISSDKTTSTVFFDVLELQFLHMIIFDIFNYASWKYRVNLSFDSQLEQWIQDLMDWDGILWAIFL